MAGIRITQETPRATPGRRYGSFAGRTPASSHPVGRLTQLAPCIIPRRHYGSFSGKAGGSTGAYDFHHYYA